MANKKFISIGIIFLIISFFLIYFINIGVFGDFGGTGSSSVYNIKCTAVVNNPAIGEASITENSISCIKSKRLFCGSPLSIISSSYSLKLVAGESSKSEFFTLVSGQKSISVSACTKENINSVTLYLFNKDDLKDTKVINVG